MPTSFTVWQSDDGQWSVVRHAEPDHSRLSLMFRATPDRVSRESATLDEHVQKQYEPIASMAEGCCADVATLLRASVGIARSSERVLHATLHAKGFEFVLLTSD